MDEIKERSILWYILPIVLGIIGGIIAYFVLRKDDKKRAERCLFIGIIVALALLPQIFSEQATMTTKQTADDELISIASIRNSSGGSEKNTSGLDLLNKPVAGDWQYGGGCPLESFVLTNGSGDIMTLNTDYVVDATYFNVTFNQSTDDNYGLIGADNNTYADYTYCQDGYIQNSGARGVTPLIGLFSVIALIAFALYWVL